MQELGRDGPHFGEEVEAVEQGAGSLACVALDCGRRAVTGAMRVRGVAAGAGIARCNQQDAGWEAGAFLGALNADFVFFERLAQALESGARELGEFVEEEHTPMCAREFTRPKRTPAAEECLGRGRVVRCAEGCLRGKSRNRTVQGLEAGELECLLLVERRKQARDFAGEQALSGAWGPLQQERVPSRRSEDGSLACMLLTADFVELGGSLMDLSHRGASVRGGKLLSAQRVCPSAQRGRGNDAHPRNQLSFGKIRGCDAKHGAERACRLGGEQDAARHRAQFACEIEFGDCEQGGGRSGDLMAGDQQRSRESQIKREATLGQLGGHQIEEHA